MSFSSEFRFIYLFLNADLVFFLTSKFLKTIPQVLQKLAFLFFILISYYTELVNVQEYNLFCFVVVIK